MRLSVLRALLLLRILSAFPAEARAVGPPLSAADVLAECGTGSDPTFKWVWHSADRARPRTTMTPLVVQLTDDDGNRRIDAADTPDVLVTHSDPATDEARIVALDGATGSPVLDIALPVLFVPLAAGDLDHDGVVEIVAVTADASSVACFENDGSTAWIVPVPGGLGYRDPLGIADLDQDGRPEITSSGVVLRSDGTLRGRGVAGRGGLLSDLHVSVAVDLLPSRPGLELVAGNTVYDADANVVWQQGLAPDGYAGVGDVDGDGAGDVVVAGLGDLWLLDSHGAPMAAPLSLASGQNLSPPTISDFDGDGIDEIFTSAKTASFVVEWTGSDIAVKWSARTNDESCCAGGSAYDFDGDGAQEIVYGDHVYARVFDGRDGRELWRVGRSSPTLIEVPVVADLDRDGTPEILVTSSELRSGHVAAHACRCQSDPRAIWNQHSYHVTNVDDDGSIPQFEAPPWEGPGWMAQSGGIVGPTCVHADACATCDDLHATIDAAEIDVEGVRRSLRAKAEAACRALARGRENAAGNVLSAILRECDAQDGQHVEHESAEAIRTCVRSFAAANGLRLRSRR